MNDLQIFNSEQFGKIRALEIDGEPWFCLSDVCKAIGIQTRDCKKRLKSDGVDTIHTADSMGRPNNLAFINEPNLYRAIFQSKKPEAEAFTDWVTEEVLPALRKTGTYTTPPAAATPIPKSLSDGMSMSGLASLIRITRRVMLDMGSTPLQVGAMTKILFDTCGIPVPVAFTQQIPGQLCWFDGPALEGKA